LRGFSEKKPNDIISILIVINRIDQSIDVSNQLKNSKENSYPYLQIEHVSSIEEAKKRIMTRIYDCVICETNKQKNFSELEQICQETNKIPLIEYSKDESISELLNKISIIVENKKLKMKISELEDISNIFLEMSYDVIFKLDLTGCITFISPIIERVAGYHPQEMLGKPFNNFFDPKKSLPTSEKGLTDTIVGQKVHGLEMDLIGKEQERIPIELSTTPLIRDRSIDGVIGLFKVITIGERNVKWQSLFEMAPDGIITLNLTGKITSANDAFFRLTGFNEEEILGKHFTKVGSAPLSEMPKLIRMFGDLIRGKEIEDVEFRYQNKNGEIKWGESRVKLIKTGFLKREMLVICRDITERKRNEEKLNNLVNELSRSNQELDDYTFAVSHDLKSPLRTIESFGSFLLEDYEHTLGEEGKNHLGRMINASKRMKNLIEDLLVISRVGRKFTEIELIDLNNIITEIKNDISFELEKNNGQIISENLPLIKTQRVWIKQLLFNLISNGLKFNKSPDPTIWINYEERSDDYLFSVKDNGIGIDKKYHDKIFRIFQRLHSEDEYPGTGAGLTICKKIIDYFGGEVWIESKLGKGSTFFFTFPKEITEERVDENEIKSLIDRSVEEMTTLVDTIDLSIIDR